MTPHINDPDFQLYVGDALEVLRTLPDESVDCVVTSPPYWGLRDYSVEGQLGLEPTPDAYVTRIVEVFREVRRVLAKHGTCWVNLGDSYNANQGAGFNGQKRQDHKNRHTVMPRTGFKPKDLVGIPWRVAFALQADGWYLRSDIIWSKPNSMPESVTDRPTKAHEYVFLLTKQPRYWFDQEAVREPLQPKTFTTFGTKHRPQGNDGLGKVKSDNWGSSIDERQPKIWGDGEMGRNVRSVWEIATQPYPEAHFATFPEELARRCILAGAPQFVCTVCNTPLVSGRQQNIPEPQAVQADVRRVRDTIRGQESEVLLETVRDEGTGSQPASPADVRELREDVQHEGQAVLLSEVLGGVGDEDGDEQQAVAEEQAGGELEGREGSRRGLRQGLRQGSGLQAGASAGDGGGSGSSAGAVGVRPPQERDQGRQQAGEPRTDDEEPASRNGDVPALRRAVRDSLSPCCNAPLRPGVVLDPFLGSGTTALVARNHGRHAIGIELSREYAELAAKRTRQLSLLAT